MTPEISLHSRAAVGNTHPTVRLAVHAIFCERRSLLVGRCGWHVTKSASVGATNRNIKRPIGEGFVFKIIDSDDGWGTPEIERFYFGFYRHGGGFRSDPHLLTARTKTDSAGEVKTVRLPEWIPSSLSANIAAHEVRDRKDCQRRPDRR